MKIPILLVFRKYFSKNYRNVFFDLKYIFKKHFSEYNFTERILLEFFFKNDTVEHSTLRTSSESALHLLLESKCKRKYSN